MSEHTPGPWVVEVAESLETGSFHYKVSNPTFDGPCPCGGTHPPGKLIAWLAGSLRGATDRDRPIEADARLIAAAPDLLAALLSVEWTGEGHDRDECWPCCPSCGAPSAAVEYTNGGEGEPGQHMPACVLAAAIAKAAPTDPAHGEKG